MNHFRRGFASELIKLSANAQELEAADAFDGADAIGKAMAPKKGLGEPVATSYGKSKNAPPALTSMMEMRGRTGQTV